MSEFVQSMQALNSSVAKVRGHFSLKSAPCDFVMTCYQDTLNFITTNFNAQLNIFVRHAFLLRTFLVFILIHNNVGSPGGGGGG